MITEIIELNKPEERLPDRPGSYIGICDMPKYRYTELTYGENRPGFYGQGSLKILFWAEQPKGPKP